MSDKFILTPYFLDSAQPELLSLAAADWQINQPALPEGDQLARMAALYDPIADHVAAAFSVGERPVSFVNDCCASLGMLAGLQRAGALQTLVWLDAHGDFNTPETTPSGFLGGMPLAWLVGRGERTLMKSLRMQPFPEERILLTDGRALDPGEAEALRDSDIVHVPKIADLHGAALPAGPLWVHFDVDIVDPSEMRAVGWPAPGGPAAEQVRSLMRTLAGSGRVVAVSVSCWDPGMDTDGTSRALTLSLLGELLGT